MWGFYRWYIAAPFGLERFLRSVTRVGASAICAGFIPNGATSP